MSKFLKFFQNNSGDNTFEVVLDNGIVLLYQLSDNPVQHAWQSLLKNRKQEVINSSFDNQTLEENIRLLNNALMQVNLVTLDNPDNQDYLNYLHSQFVDSKGELPVWREINKRIHQIENYKKLNIDYNYAFSFFLDPRPESLPISEIHKMWIGTDHTNWGMLSLSYETVGKDWVDLSIDNDDIDELAIKTSIGTETWCSFVLDPVCHKRAETRLWEWYLTQPLDIQNKIPINDLNSLALGDYLLGKLIITEPFINFHSTISDWYVPNHACKLNWNKELLSSARSVKSYRFYNSTIAHDVMVEHTGILNA